MDDMQKDFSPAADADSIDDMADDMIEMTDEEGNTTLFKILDYFFYNGDEYAILTDSIDEGSRCYGKPEGSKSLKYLF